MKSDAAYVHLTHCLLRQNPLVERLADARSPTPSANEDSPPGCSRCDRTWPCPSVVEGYDLAESVPEGYGVRLSPMTPYQEEVIQLVLEGWVEDSGLRRPDANGMPAIAFRVTASGVARLETLAPLALGVGTLSRQETGSQSD